MSGGGGANVRLPEEQIKSRIYMYALTTGGLTVIIGVNCMFAGTPMPCVCNTWLAVYLTRARAVNEYAYCMAALHSSAAHVAMPIYQTCHGKNGLPKIGSGRNNFFEKYGPPATYFTAKFGPPLKNLDPSKSCAGTIFLMNMDPPELFLWRYGLTAVLLYVLVTPK